MSTIRVLCAGDAFITADRLAMECRAQLADLATVQPVLHESDWPDEPFGDVDGVREAAGDPGDIAALAADVEVIVTHLAPVTAAVIDGAGQLRLIGCTRGGPVNIDVGAATSARVPVAYLPGRNLTAAAEYAVGMMLALTRNIAAGAAQLAQGVWDGGYFRLDRTGPEIGSSTIGLVGFGAIGSHVGRLLVAFGARVLVADPYADEALVHAVGAEPVDLTELLSRSDLVSMHARLTPQTRHMADATFFARMQTGAFFVNTARGELTDTAALTAALEAGHLGGAALDVFDPEPPPADSALLGMPRVVATPHLAGASRRVVIARAVWLTDGSSRGWSRSSRFSGQS